MESIILLDTDAVVNFFANNDARLTETIVNYKKENKSKILVTFFTWYELFKSTIDFKLIKAKLINIDKFTDGLDIYEDIPYNDDELYNPRFWLNNSHFQILEFNQFILRIKELVYNRINAHIMDILLVEINTILFFDYKLDMANIEKERVFLTYYPYLMTMRDRFRPALMELLRRHADDSKYLNSLLFEMYKGTQVLVTDYNETEVEFISRIKKFSYTDIIKILNSEKKSNSSSGLNLTSKDALLDSIYDDFYNNDDNFLSVCKKFIFRNSPIAGGKFNYNDFIDMSNLLLSQKTSNADVAYITNDKKWINFISVLSDKHSIIIKTISDEV